jgi:hypothetical protein
MHRMLRNTFLTSRRRLVERDTSFLGGEEVEIESMMPYRLRLCCINRGRVW